MIANGSSLVSLITDKEYDSKIAGYLHDDCCRRLYAILKANLLFIFKSAERLEIPLLLIIMEDCVVELADDNSTGLEHSFVIRFNTTGQTYVMATENQENLKNWISLLTSCSIEFMRATKESLEFEHDDRDRLKEQEKKEQESENSKKN